MAGRDSRICTLRPDQTVITVLLVKAEAVNGCVFLFEERPLVAGVSLGTNRFFLLPINEESGAVKSFLCLGLPTGVFSYPTD